MIYFWLVAHPGAKNVNEKFLLAIKIQVIKFRISFFFHENMWLAIQLSKILLHDHLRIVLKVPTRYQDTYWTRSKILLSYAAVRIVNSRSKDPGNALAQVQRVHEPVDLWDITFCTRRFWGPELFSIEKNACPGPYQVHGVYTQNWNFFVLYSYSVWNHFLILKVRCMYF